MRCNMHNLNLNRLLFVFILLILFCYCDKSDNDKDYSEKENENNNKEKIETTQKKMIPAEYNYKWGFINNKGKFIIQPDFDNVKDFSDGLASIEWNFLWGYIDKSYSKSKRFVIKPYFNNARPFNKGYAPVEKNFLWGFIDKKFSPDKKNYIVNPVYEQLGKYSDDVKLAPAMRNRKWGFVYYKGETIIDFQFDEAKPFKESFAPVKTGDKWGYIDKSFIENENYFIKPVFDYAEGFSDGLAKVRRDGIYNYINIKGQFVFPNIYDNKTKFLPEFSEGLAPIEINGKWGFIDKNFSYDENRVYVTEPQYDYALDFSEGYAGVSLNGKYGFIDSNGQIVIEPQFDIVWGFSEGLAMVKLFGKYGFIDKQFFKSFKRKYVVDPIYEDADSFYNDTAPISKNGVWGYLKKDGFIGSNIKVIELVKPALQRAYRFSDGIAGVRVNNKYGFIDLNGKYITEPVYENIKDFEDGFAQIKLEGNYGFIDKEGNYEIKPMFDKIYQFSESFAKVRLDNDSYGYISKTYTNGKIRIEYSIPAVFDDAEHFSEGLALVKVGNKFGYIDKSLALRDISGVEDLTLSNEDSTSKSIFSISPKFDDAFSFYEGFARVGVKGKYGCIDKRGDYIIEPAFDYIYGYSNRTMLVQLSDKYGFITKRGEYIVEPILDEMPVSGVDY